MSSLDSVPDFPLGTANSTRHHPHFVAALFMVTMICGLVDAACYLGLNGVFAEIMTGNIVLMGFAAAQQHWDQAAGFLVAIIPFCVGALLGGWLIRKPEKLHERRIGFVVEWILMVLATVLAFELHPKSGEPSRHLIVAVVALAMGIQNAMVRRHGIAALVTNLATTNLVALFADSRLAGGEADAWRMRGISIVVLFLSGALGAVVLLHFGLGWALLVPTLVLTVALVPLIRLFPPDLAS